MGACGLVSQHEMNYVVTFMTLKFKYNYYTITLKLELIRYYRQMRCLSVSEWYGVFVLHRELNILFKALPPKVLILWQFTQVYRGWTVYTRHKIWYFWVTHPSLTTSFKTQVCDQHGRCTHSPFTWLHARVRPSVMHVVDVHTMQKWNKGLRSEVTTCCCTQIIFKFAER